MIPPHLRMVFAGTLGEVDENSGTHEEEEYFDYETLLAFMGHIGFDMN